MKVVLHFFLRYLPKYFYVTVRELGKVLPVYSRYSFFVPTENPWKASLGPKCVYEVRISKK